MTKLSTIEGIGPVYEEKLIGAGVTSCEGLLEQGATAAGRKQIEEASGIDHKRVLRFVQQLFRGGHIRSVTYWVSSAFPA